MGSPITNHQSRIPVVLLMGPTASGKTGLALALAEHLAVEIISVDSAQVYRGMDIGTAKPDAATLARVPHHLIDVADPAEPYSAARFREDALRLIEEIRTRGRIPLLAGGTMLYFRALQEGLNDLPPADPALRARIEAEARAQGWPALHARLATLDPETAQRLAPMDKQRIQRALEIVELSGKPASAWHREPRSSGLAGPCVKLGLNLARRADLHERIHRRFLEMIEQGFVEEVRRLRALPGLHVDLPAMRAVGYQEIWRHLDGEYGLPTATERGIAATRQLAKRQLTWMRSEKELRWLDVQAPDLLDQALQAIGTAGVKNSVINSPPLQEPKKG